MLDLLSPVYALMVSIVGNETPERLTKSPRVPRTNRSYGATFGSLSALAGMIAYLLFDGRPL